MASSMIGSLVQLPGVGGGSQLAIISTLQHVFNVPRELALSCGILLWLVTFMSVIPLGLALAHRERLSIRGLSKETAVEEEKAISSQPSGQAQDTQRRTLRAKIEIFLTAEADRWRLATMQSVPNHHEMPLLRLCQ